ncbi:MAG: amidohydrolase family protein [Caldilineaceae bacterium]
MDAQPVLQVKLFKSTVFAFGLLLGVMLNISYSASAFQANLLMQAVKFTADGSIQGFTARLRPPYYYKTGANGLWNRSPEELTALVGTMHAAGYQVACHCNGDQQIP